MLKDTRFALRMSSEDLEKLDALSRKLKRSRSGVVRYLVDTFHEAAGVGEDEEMENQGERESVPA